MQDRNIDYQPTTTTWETRLFQVIFKRVPKFRRFQVVFKRVPQFLLALRLAYFKVPLQLHIFRSGQAGIPIYFEHPTNILFTTYLPAINFADIQYMFKIIYMYHHHFGGGDIVNHGGLVDVTDIMLQCRWSNAMACNILSYPINEEKGGSKIYCERQSKNNSQQVSTCNLFI